MTDQPTDTAARLLRHCADLGWTLAAAESLTGGALTSALVAVPGASAVLRGGVVAYATDLKATLLGVDPDLLARAGAVSDETAAAMAQGVRRVAGADVGLATTGVAGPDLQEGKEPGRVHVAVATPDGVTTRRLDLRGDRSAVRGAAVEAALALALRWARLPGPAAGHDGAADGA
ncbi:CinA family protein [Luteimicrobium subarcticum]|uniref:Nicotinamide-nucleotide amidase n=1 Tax=Luteimicrobium subarcticum TaxID=620910 RepID=A0A2M8WTW7_9MICO|nr:nicotinamide-nucleotide amidohydrolase family protein [Luteimicrobium subarcticum]PJI94385.1 nicotinamide-nucleotide amidase [Luteimicrobium subarcticum]